MVDDDINQTELENEMEKGLTIDYETADKITVLVLREHVEMLESEQREIEELDTVPGYKHADYFANREILVALRKVLDYYGG